MSYLNNVRLVFSGQFQSDVSTVNNDVKHYDIAKFKPEYQQYNEGPNANGWWNPCGSGAFRLINCKVTEVGLADGTSTTADPVVGMSIGGSDDTVSAKMLDLDPQMQMVSEIWGLTMRLTDGKTPALFEGQFVPAPFRDILFGRQQGARQDGAATAIYQSILTDVSWADDLPDSPFITQLRQLLDTVGALSVRMMVYSYIGDHNNAEFTLGQVSGVIGPAFVDEPTGFILGRRFAPRNGNSTAENVNFFNAQVDVAHQSITLDLSNALPLLNGQSQLVDIGQLQLVVLLNGSGGDDQGSPVSHKDFLAVGDVDIDYLADGFLTQKGALFTVNNLSPALMALLQSNPLALLRVNSKGNEVVIRETQEGLLVRADAMVHRLMPTAQSTVEFWASRYGIASVGESIDLSLQPPTSASDGPINNIPPSAMTYEATTKTGKNGKVSYDFYVTNPDNPRGYIDGQLYFLSYGPVAAPSYIQQSLDMIAVLVFDAFTVPALPTWQDLKPIMLQYANLYPVMSRMLVDLGNYESVVSFRSLLELAFSRDVGDPNHMPVTRDLSSAKRDMIIKWLTAKDAQGKYTLLRGTDTPPVTATMESCASCTLDTVPAESLTDSATEGRPMGSKERANAHYRRHCK